jgi:hypothetical protein
MERDGNSEYYARLLKWLDPGYFLLEKSTGTMRLVVSREENGKSQRFGSLYRLETVFGKQVGHSSSMDFEELHMRLMNGTLDILDGEQGSELIAHKQAESIVEGHDIVTVRSGTRRRVVEIAGNSLVLQVVSGPHEGQKMLYGELAVVKGLFQGIIVAETSPGNSP